MDLFWVKHIILFLNWHIIHFWSIQKFQIVRIWCRVFFQQRSFFIFTCFLSIIFTYYVMHEKKIVVGNLSGKKCFFSWILGSFKKKIPKGCHFWKLVDDGGGGGWISQITDNDWNKKGESFFDTLFILVADAFQLPNLRWTVANFFFEKRSIEAIFGVVAIRILAAIWRGRGPQSRRKCTTTKSYSSSCHCFHWILAFRAWSMCDRSTRAWWWSSRRW